MHVDENGCKYCECSEEGEAVVLRYLLKQPFSVRWLLFLNFFLESRSWPWTIPLQSVSQQPHVIIGAKWGAW